MEFLEHRFNRATYWLCLAILAAIATSLELSGVNVGGMGFVLALLYVFRVHDLGWSGKWVLLYYFIQIAAGVIAGFTIQPDHFPILAIVEGVIVVAVTIALGSLPGEKVSNPYGAPPPPGLSFKGRETTK